MRECAEVINGQMCIIRLGTCGTPNKDIKLGTIVVQKESLMISRNPNGFRKNSKEKAYNISELVQSNPDITNLVIK